MPKPEFDAYASQYNAGMDNPTKRLMGDDAEIFIEVKARWLLRDLINRASWPAPFNDLNLLDFGCGVGTFLKVLDRLGFSGALRGCDTSPGMVAEARRTWANGARSTLCVISETELPYADQTFDLVIASAVFHHIPVMVRPQIYQEIHRVLKASGRLYIFEHNPFNPVTRWVVKNTPIDKNAILLSPGEPQQAMANVRLKNIYTKYLMFFPPRWRLLWHFQDFLSWIPLGGQYVTVGIK